MVFAYVLGIFLALVIVAGAPMVLGFGSAALLPLLMGVDTYDLISITNWTIAGNKNIYLAIAFFIVAGNLMSEGKIAQRIYEFFAYFLGDKKSFLPICTLLTAAFYGMVSGSAIAVTAAIGTMCLPILTRIGYDKVYYTAVLASAGCLGMIIPPTSVALSTGGLTGANITDTYKLCMVIGLTLAASLIVCSLIHCRKEKNLDMDLILAEHSERKANGLWSTFTDSIWAMLSPIIILGSIFSGIFTANEAAAISVLYSALIAVYIYKTLTWKQVWEVILKSVKTIAPLCMVLAMANTFSFALPETGINEWVAGLLDNTTFSEPSILFLVTIIITSLTGFFMNAGNIIIPIMLPWAEQIGTNLEVWTTIMTATGSIALLTPPFGYGLMIMAPMAGISIGRLFKKVFPFWLMMTAIITVFAITPGLMTWAL
ncbi:TRAP transporter large permease [Clostridium phoceensis]|uniref:TRAP transporter large permease n=1 Tax=Clostridium phoceensis TaxID=1650661 RepID=UPI00067EA212|nr:TRAP transporter large permease [Clostridium phoceensis]